MRQYVVLFLILMIPFMPFASQDVEGDVVATSETITIEYYGSAGEVSILGEWDWDNETELIEVDGVWTAELIGRAHV